MNAKMPISSDIPMIMMIVLVGMNKDFSIYSPGKKECAVMKKTVVKME